MIEKDILAQMHDAEELGDHKQRDLLEDLRSRLDQLKLMGLHDATEEERKLVLAKRVNTGVGASLPDDVELADLYDWKDRETIGRLKSPNTPQEWVDFMEGLTPHEKTKISSELNPFRRARRHFSDRSTRNNWVVRVGELRGSFEEVIERIPIRVDSLRFLITMFERPSDSPGEAI